MKNVLIGDGSCSVVERRHANALSGFKSVHVFAIEDDASSFPAPAPDVVLKAVNRLICWPLGDGSG